MGIDEKEREQAILDAGAQLLLQYGYNKTTMNDVADAVGLHRGLIYLPFPSKDALIEALILREINRYAEAWSNHLDADPWGGTVASVYRNMFQALKPFPLMAAIMTRNEDIFGKYLRKPGNLFTRLPISLTLDFLQTMQKAGAVRQDVNISAMALILDALAPTILDTLTSQLETLRGHVHQTDRPSFDALMETITEMLERMLTPEGDAHLAEGKAALHHDLDQAQTRFTSALESQKKENM